MILKNHATKFALFASKFENPGSKKPSFANRSPFMAHSSYAHSYTQSIVFVRDPGKPDASKQAFFLIFTYSSPSHQSFASQ